MLGGVLAQKLGWWWIFYLLAILAGAYVIPLLLFFPETSRAVVGNGSKHPRGVNASFVQLFRGVQGRETAARPVLRWPNPIPTLRLIFQKDMALVLFVNGILYVAFYAVMTSLPSLFVEIYMLDELQVGLCYLSFGAGCAVSCLATGKIIDRDYRVLAREEGIAVDKKKGEDMRKFPIEKARLRSIFWVLGVYVAMLLCYGWVLHVETVISPPPLTRTLKC